MSAHLLNLIHGEKALLEQICDYTNLYKAFKSVKRNKGAPGIDGITIEEFKTNLSQELKQIRHEVLTWTYKPTPVKRVEIPKPNGKGVRLLGIPTIKDRVLHMAIKQILEPILDPDFSPNSYGFRPGRNQRQAVEAARDIIIQGKEYVVDIDLSKFFDRINHDRLIHRLGTKIQDKRVLRLIGMILRSGVMSKGIVTTSKEGSVQGSPLSPLLSNVVLDELDKELENRGLEFCRFADDCNIFVKTMRAAERVMESITKFIESKLKLKVNGEKSQVAKSDRVKFLGMTIVNGSIAIAKASYNKAMEKIKQLIPRGTHETIRMTIKRVNTWYRGWANYFQMTQFPAQLAALEAHIRRRLRARFVRQQKNQRNLVSALVKRGVNKSYANKVVYANNGPWKLSYTRVLHTAFPNRWFQETGLLILSQQEQDHWFHAKKWVKLM